MHSSSPNTTLSKGKGVLVQGLKACKGSRNRGQLILNLRTDVNRGEWSTSRPGRFTRAENPGTRWIGGWVGPARVSTFLKKRKISSPCQDTNPGPFSMQRSPNADYATPCTMLYMLRIFWLVIRSYHRFLLRVFNTFYVTWYQQMLSCDVIKRVKNLNRNQRKPRNDPKVSRHVRCHMNATTNTVNNVFI